MGEIEPVGRVGNIPGNLALFRKECAEKSDTPEYHEPSVNYDAETQYKLNLRLEAVFLPHVQPTQPE